jgi:protocatechuate 3,4-dioxygenase beta subunit
MNRKDFLKAGVGIVGIGAVIPFIIGCDEDAATEVIQPSGSCVLIPEETAGPYPLDLSKSQVYFRQDITEGKTGLPLKLTLTIVNANNNCTPIANARVDVWHCDKDGNYSGYSSEVGETYCRGIQLTDANGQVTFQTIYPGWYRGRITHIHFQVFLNNGLVATSQLAFPDAINESVYKTSLYAAKGQNTSVANNRADSIFRDGETYQLAKMTANVATGGYDATLQVGVAV